MIETQTRFRLAFLAFAVLPGAAAAWILSAEIARALPGDGTCRAASVARWRGDKPAIVTVHRQAAPEGRRAIEAAVTEVDTGLLGALRAAAR